MALYTVILLYTILLCNEEIFASNGASREKRCIVIQKQSGGRADSGEGGEDEGFDYKRPPPKNQLPDRLQTTRVTPAFGNEDIEDVSPEYLKYNAPVLDRLKKLRMRNRYRNSFQ